MKTMKKCLVGFGILFSLMNSCMNIKEKAVVKIGTKEAFFTYIAGEVTINRGGKEEEAALDSLLMENDLIKTGSNATCDIQFGKSAYIRVEENTIFKLEQLSVIPNNARNTLRIQMGSVLCKIKKLLEKEDFSIATETAVVSVRGTTFGVRISESSDTSVFVNTGRVLLLPQAMNISLPAAADIKEKIKAIIEKHALYLNPLEETTITAQAATAAAAVFAEAQKILETVTEDNITTLEALIDTITSNAMTGLPVPHAISDANNSALDSIKAINFKNVSVTGIPQQLAVFKDINLEAAVRGIIKKPAGDMYVSDLKGIKKLDVKGKLITVLDGIENLENLSFLNVAENPIKDFSILEKLEKLEVLIIGYADPKDSKWYHNEKIDTATLANLTNLKVLHLAAVRGSHSFEKIDIGFLSNLTNLVSLQMGWNNITDISPLEKLVDLKNLIIPSTNISDLSSLAKLTKLIRLSVDSNRITDISPLRHLTNLRVLAISDNRITDISPLANLKNIGDVKYVVKNLTEDEIELAWHKISLSFPTLSLNNNMITDISPLLINFQNGGLRKLPSINIKNNDMDLTPGTENRKIVDILVKAGLKVEFQEKRVKYFYTDFGWPDAMEAIDNDTLIIVLESASADGAGLIKGKRGTSYSKEDIFSGLGAPYGSPDGVVRMQDNRFIVTDSKTRSLFVVPAAGGPPEIFVDNIESHVNPAIAPPGFIGDNIAPGDILIPEFKPPKITAFNPLTKESKVFVGPSFFKNSGEAGPLEFGPDNKLYMVWTDMDGVRRPPRVYRFSPDGTGEIFLQLPNHDYNKILGISIDIDPVNQWLYYTPAPVQPTEYSGYGTVFRKSLVDATDEFVIDLGVNCQNIELAPDNNSLFLGSYNAIKEVVLKE